MSDVDNRKTRLWRKNNPEKVREYKRRHYAKHKEQLRAKNRAYYIKNREHILELEKIRCEKNAPILKARARADYAARPEYYKAQRLRFKQTNRASVICSSTKKAARVQGVAFDLTQDWFHERLQCGVCEMSGLPFDMTAKRGANSPSVDRIDPKGGYTKANCRLILWSINRALSNYGETYLLYVFERILARRQWRQAA